MTYRVVALRRAEADICAIVHWIAKRSQTGAIAWLDAYDSLVKRLRYSPLACGPAAEDTEIELPLKQAFFRTRRGRSYRAIFVIVGSEVRILRVRGPGQDAIEPNEII